MSALAELRPPRSSLALLATSALPELLRPTAHEKQVLVALCWGKTVLELATVRPGGAYVRRLPSCGMLPVPLIRWKAEEVQLLVPELAGVRFERDGRETPMRELVVSGQAREVQLPCPGTTLALGLGDVVRVPAGGVELVIRFVRPEPAPKRGLVERLDASFLSTVAIALMAAFLLTRMIALQSFGSVPLDEALRATRATYVTRALPPPLPPIRLFAPARAPAGGVAHAGPPGKSGATKGQPHDLPGNALATLDEMRAAVSSLGQDGGLTKALTQLGTGLVADRGPGLDETGSREGGNGPPGSLGIGEHPFGPVMGPDRGALGLDPHRHGIIAPPMHEVMAEGMDPETIDRIVRRHWNELRYCYEKALQRDPNLRGKVAIFFRIESAGTVDEAHVSESTLGSASAEACLVANVRRWRFPPPKGGGVVLVTYPFIFEAE